MTTFKQNIWIDAPKEKVWEIIADLGAVQNFHPSVQKSYYSSDKKEGLGAARVCELLPVGKVEEKAIEWREGEGYLLDVIPVEKAPPFKKSVGGFNLKQDGQGTRATLTLEYTLKYGLLGQLMDIFLVRPQLKKVVPRVLAGLKHYTETGEEITPEVIRKIKPTMVTA